MFRTRLARLKEADTRKVFAGLLAGKLLGVGTMLGIVKAVAWYFGTSVSAAPIAQAAEAVNATINPLNTLWVLIAAFLVFFMQAGFMALEAGFARSREVVNIMIECIVDTCLCGILYFAVGFAFQFGNGNGFIGHSYFFLGGREATYGTTGIAFLAFFLFQFAFADTASTITSGAMVGRTGFKGDLLYSLGVSGIIYPVVGHWIWGPGGWLGAGTIPWVKDLSGGATFRDFAGSTVVHTTGGMLALAGAIVLGPRLGRVFKRDGGGLFPGHDMVMASVGAVILWFGWYGFNPGSTLSAMDFEGIGRVATNTTLAACAGGLVTLAFVYPRSKVWDTGMTINGFLGGLVAITAPCYWVSPGGAIAIGAIAGVIVPLGVDLIEHLRIDDPIGAVAVHGFCGIWGTISIGLFATGGYGVPGPNGADTSAGTVTGLFYSGGVDQLVAQVVGSLVVTVGVFVVGYALMKAIMLAGQLRISPEGEVEGIDVHEHGAPAYHMEIGAGMSHPTPVSSSLIEKGAKKRTPDSTSV
jgi:Amt family ammonium transporter